MNKYQEALNRIAKYCGVNNSSMLEDALKTLQELVDKATPKKPKIEIDDNDYCDYFVCPNCYSTLYEDTEHLKRNHFEDSYNQKIENCHCCGQALKWKD